MRRHAFFLSCAVAIAAALLGGCAKRTIATRPAPGTLHAQKEAGLTPEKNRFRDIHCLMGCPVLSRGAGYGPTVMLYRGGYVLEHSSIDKIPLWVAEKVSVEQIGGSATRDDKFKPDPELAPGARAELADYKRSGYDRGHLAPAGNQTRDEQLKAETFFLSNMCPQAPVLNQQAWRELEDRTRKWVKNFGAAWEFTGPMFYDPEEDDPAKADGVVNYFTIGSNRVAVPTHFYKIVVAREGEGPWRSIAFVMENRPYQRPFRFEEHIRSIDWIERRTGLDFLPEMEMGQQRRLEAEPSPMWN